MPDLTTSAPVDTLMAATTKAQIATAVGVGTADDVTHAKITSTSGIWILSGASRIADLFAYSPNMGMHNLGMIRWESTTTITGANDLGIGRSAAGVLEVNNGTAGTLRDIKANALQLPGGGQVTGTVGGPVTITGGNSWLHTTYFRTEAVSVAGSIGMGTTNGIYLTATAENILTVYGKDQTGTFNRLNLGGVTSAFPALRRAAAGIEVRVADDTSYSDLTCRNVIQKPPISVVPAANGDLVFQATSDTTLTIKYKGTDGIVRSVALTLA